MLISLETLRALPLFSNLTHEESATLIQNSRLKNCQQGQFLFMHGDPISHFYVLCRGTMQLFRETPDGHEVTSAILIAGDSICPDELLQPGILHQSNARAVEDSILLELSTTWIRNNLDNFDHLLHNLYKDISYRLHETQIDAEHQATMTAAQLVACFLQRVCILYHFDLHEFTLPYSKTLIASRLGMELETFSRALNTLRKHGIEVKGSRVSFTQLAKAQDLSCGTCSVNGECRTHHMLQEKLSMKEYG